MNTEAVSAAIAHDNQSVLLGLKGQDGKVGILQTQKVVIAAGPWTPSVFHSLFPDSSVDLEPTIDAGDWMLLKNPHPSSRQSIAAIYLDDIVGEKLEFAGRNDGTIWVTGRRSFTGAVPPVGSHSEPDKEMIQSLTASSKRFLEHGSDDISKMIIKTGRSYRPATKSMLPVFAGLRSRCLSAKSLQKQGPESPIVFINSGHGSYGITLGMGSGKLMSQIISGRKESIKSDILQLYKEL
ncbi:MAG: hypothetical protein Q9190_001010 [Brigantiaea leucoxantha]